MKSTSRSCICLAVVVTVASVPTQGEQGRCLEVPLASLHTVVSVPTQGEQGAGNNHNYAVTMIPTQGHSQARQREQQLFSSVHNS